MEHHTSVLLPLPEGGRKGPDFTAYHFADGNGTSAKGILGAGFFGFSTQKRNLLLLWCRVVLYCIYQQDIMQMIAWRVIDKQL